MKLHIGGEEIKNDWKILNIQKKEGVDFVGDISDLSQFENNSIEEIYASHVLEHVVQKKVESTLKGIHRVLKTGGKFYVSVPDMDLLCKIFIEPKAPPSVKWSTMRMMFGGQDDKYDFHYFGWNFKFLNDFLLKVGFQKIQRVKTFSLFKDVSKDLMQTRMIKSAEEIEIIKNGARIADIGGNEIVKNIKVGENELEIAIEVEIEWKEKLQKLILMLNIWIPGFGFSQE